MAGPAFILSGQSWEKQKKIGLEYFEYDMSYYMIIDIMDIISITHRIHGAAIYGVPWIPSIYPSHVSIYTSTMDSMGNTLNEN